MTTTFPNESIEHRAARNQLLEAEIKLRRAMEAVAQARRALPPGGLVPQDYAFDGLDAGGKPAKIKLSDLFAPDTDSLIVYNFMFPRYSRDDRPKPASGETAKLAIQQGPCPSCTALLDQLDGAAGHLDAAGFNFVVIAKAPLERLTTFGRERGWTRLRLLSSAGNDFKRDFHAENKEGEQMPMVTVFHRAADGIRHFWSSEMLYEPTEPGQDPRHAGLIEPLWNLMDLTREGRPDWDEQLQYERRDDAKAGKAA